MLKVALVGLGTIAQIHMHAINISESAEIVCVCDIDESKKNAYEQFPFYKDMEDMLKNEEIDCVHLCLPHYLHVEATKLFAKYGVHVFTEKPVALSYDEATELFGLEKEHNIKIGVCLQNRYNATSILLKDLIQSEKYGKLIGSKGIVTWSRTMDYYKESPWRGIMKYAGGGVMINQTVHTIDLLQHIGEDIKSINALCGNISLDIEVEDTVVAKMKYKNGGDALFFGTNSYCTNSSVELEFVCEEGILKISDNKCFLHINGEEPKFLCEDIKLEGSKHYYGASHHLAIEAFYKAILNNTDEYISVCEAAKSLKIIEGVRASQINKKEMEI